jgi:hypothetical protein|tara:strand:+ start:35 stop:508 length:474 start_codon:yes stop_codon:yes gene_type:complete
MQTFLPYHTFKESASALDWKRLGKQRVEAMQIINAIEGRPRKDGKPYKGWINHPCSVMWGDYVIALKQYANTIIDEWINRGYKNNMKFYNIKLPFEMPHWLGNKEFHSSHRANLLRKDYEYYSQFGWTEDPKLPYVWHDVDGLWYKQDISTGKRLYL